MEFDDLTNVDGPTIRSLFPLIDKPTKIGKNWFCPIDKVTVINFNHVERFDIENRVLYFNVTNESVAKGVPQKLEVEIELK